MHARGEQTERVRYVYTRRARRIAFESVAMLTSTGLLAGLPASAESEGERPWSPPTALTACSAGVTPQILFPDDTPQHATGPGAIVWSSAPSCSGGAGARLSAIAPGGDVPAPATAPSGGTGRELELSEPLAAAAAPHGQIVLAGKIGRATLDKTAGAGAGTAAAAAGELGLSEGSAHGPFSSPQSTGGRAKPLALTTAYLGDLAIASPGGSSGGGAIELRIHRYYAHSFLPPITVSPAARQPAEGLTLAMDYRSDALAVWERAGTIYARYLPGPDRSARSVARVAAAAPHARIAALLSDDNRAILAWSETRAGVTSVYAELSAPGVQLGAVRLLERFADPHGLTPPSGSPRLVRLSSESVMLAWSGAQAGHWVVHTAAVDLNGVRSIDTISAPGHDALLTDLAPGPDGEAIALWTEPQPAPAGVSLDRQAIYAARGVDAYPGKTIFAAPELVSSPGTPSSAGPSSEASVAIDPDSDRAIAAWRTAGGAIVYSLRALS
jgi:hypothetical protein